MSFYKRHVSFIATQKSFIIRNCSVSSKIVISTVKEEFNFTQ